MCLFLQSVTAMGRLMSATSTRRLQTYRSAWTSTANTEEVEFVLAAATIQLASTVRAALLGTTDLLRFATYKTFKIFKKQSHY